MKRLMIKATEMGMPTQTLYVMMMLGTAVAVGLGVLVFTGSALVASFSLRCNYRRRGLIQVYYRAG